MVLLDSYREFPEVLAAILGIYERMIGFYFTFKTSKKMLYFIPVAISIISDQLIFLIEY